MVQDQWVTLAYKIVLIADVLSALLFVAVYTHLTHGYCWRKGNRIGRSIVIVPLILAGAFVPAVLSMFFKFNRLTSHIGAWFDLCWFAALAIAMFWRIVVWSNAVAAAHSIAEQAPMPSKAIIEAAAGDEAGRDRD